jgi:hypothetical protein
MNNLDYIPRKDRDFHEWVKFFYLYAGEHLEEWGLSPRLLDEAMPLLADFEAAYERTIAPNRGKIDVHAKDEARAALNTATRALVRAYFARNPAINAAERGRLGLPVYDHTRSRAPLITSIPLATIDFSVKGCHLIRVRDEEHEGRARPRHALGFETWRAFGDTAPARDADFSFAGLAGRSPVVLDYPLEERGKTVHYRFRWINTRHKPGPWSDVQRAIIS